MNGVDLVIVVLALVALWLGQRWLDRRTKRIAREKHEREAADVALRDAIERMRSDQKCGASAHHLQESLIEVIRAWNRRYANVPDAEMRWAMGPMYQAMQELHPVNEREH
jgi:hypothetical protein